MKTNSARHVSVRFTSGGNAQHVQGITYKLKGPTKKMVSIRTLTWTFFMMQLVISCACFVASLAIICAKMNSVSKYEDRQYVSFEWWLFCFLSLSMIVNTVIAMYALSEHNRLLLLPHIFFLVLCNSLACYTMHYSISSFDSADFNSYIGLSVILCTETFLLACLIFEIRAVRSMTWYVYTSLSFLLLLSHPNSPNDFAMFLGFLLTENIPRLFTENKQFRSLTTVLTCLQIFYFFSTLLALICTFVNLSSFLKAHFVINISLLILFIMKLLILVIDGNIASVILCLTFTCINSITLVYESRFLRDLPY